MTSFTHVNVAHHFFGGNGGVDTTNTALMDIHVEFHALESSQKENDRNRRDTRENYSGCDAQNPTGITRWFCHTLKQNKNKILEEILYIFI